MIELNILASCEDLFTDNHRKACLCEKVVAYFLQALKHILKPKRLPEQIEVTLDIVMSETSCLCYVFILHLLPESHVFRKSFEFQIIHELKHEVELICIYLRRWWGDNTNATLLWRLLAV